jgi:predicted nucleotidyltransferase
MSLLAEILSSKIRAHIFSMLFGIDAKPLHVREIERQSGLAIGTVQQELQKLLRLELIQKYKDGNRLYYQANKAHPLYPDVRSMVLKTAGAFSLLRAALAGQRDIKIVFAFGSVARGDARAASDIDLMVIGGIGLRKLTALLSGVSEEVGREINPYVVGLSEFTRRGASGDHFIKQILKEPKIFIIGTEDELTAMV